MQKKEIQLGSLVVWNPILTQNGKRDPWSGWVGLVIREIPGTEETKVVSWHVGSADGKTVVTSNGKRDLRLAYEI